MKDDDDRLTDVDRRSIRILATSTKTAAPANARIADRLERAAGTGDRADYRRAEASFDALPADERRRIGTQAEKQAETERRLVTARKRRSAAPKPSRALPAPVDETLDWKPLLLDHSPATDEPMPMPRPPADASKDGGNWRLGRPVTGPSPQAPSQHRTPPGEPSVPRPAAPKPSGGHPATSRGPAVAPADPTRTRKPAAPAAKKDDPEKGWDWQKIPEDPALRSTRKKPEALDPIQELRRQMLGDETKRR